MAIVITCTIKLDPTKREDALLKARPFIEQSRAEPGCIAYNWSADLSEPDTIYVIEHWADEKSLQDHFSAPAYTGTLAMFGEIGPESIEASKYRVDVIEPIYDEDGNPRADFFTA